MDVLEVGDNDGSWVKLAQDSVMSLAAFGISGVELFGSAVRSYVLLSL
jgi:hypothetical protein